MPWLLRKVKAFSSQRVWSVPGNSWSGKAMPMYINGAWEYQNYNTPATSPWVDRDGAEILKTHLYEAQGWDASSGWPTRATLEGLDLGFVADKLQAAGKLGT